MPERRAFSVSIFARHEGRVLLIHHARLATWLPVGGEVDGGETPLEAARRELREETGLDGTFPTLASAVDGEPPGFLGYEEHVAGQKGVHMNFVFVADVAEDAAVAPNHEFSDYRWVGAAELGALSSPKNVRELGFKALAAR
ncbi:MAG TPA: NUDIX domain-containing protein [Planctomycetota bacterium]|nr:NUDIX domain-containing protein [Planctomycetota bacterium]